MQLSTIVKLHKTWKKKAETLSVDGTKPPAWRVKTYPAKSLLTNPAQWSNKIIFRQVNEGKKKNKYSACLRGLSVLAWINPTLPQGVTESGMEAKATLFLS